MGRGKANWGIVQLGEPHSEEPCGLELGSFSGRFPHKIDQIRRNLSTTFRHIC